MSIRHRVSAAALLVALWVTSTPLAAQDGGVRRTPIVRVVESVAPAVVNISAESIVRAVDPFFGGLFGSRERRAQSLGSGLIIDPAGIVITNAHVIEGASKIVVVLRDGRELEADVLGADRDADLAVLKVGERGLPSVPLGASTDLLMGETVIALGNPFGLSNTVTTGVLSARGRTVPSERGGVRFSDFLQTDASINPGNSGGPLVNLEGAVIGINTAIVQGANGIGFAIPADRAQRVVSDLLRFGELQPIWTGLRLETVDAELARRSGLPANRGALVVRVFEGSPAARAGVREGDQVVAIGRQPVSAREDISTAFYSAPVATPLLLEVRRGNQTLRLAVAAERPPRGLGLAVLEAVPGLRVRGGREGLVIDRVERGSPAARAGLRAGDRVLAANGQRLGELEELSREVLRAVDRGGLFLVVGRGRYAYNLNLPL
jgi:serine protease Do